MTFLLDANVLVYALGDTAHRPNCERLIRAVEDRMADGVISTAILEEVWHIELHRRVRISPGTTADYYELFAPLIAITDDVFKRALTIDIAQLGANDRVHAATCLEAEIRTIVSGDAAFDRVRGLRRVDPLDTGAIERLLR